jgi:hypothetical protein
MTMTMTFMLQSQDLDGYVRFLSDALPNPAFFEVDTCLLMKVQLEWGTKWALGPSGSRPSNCHPVSLCTLYVFQTLAWRKKNI